MCRAALSRPVRGVAPASSAGALAGGRIRGRIRLEPAHRSSSACSLVRRWGAGAPLRRRSGRDARASSGAGVARAARGPLGASLGRRSSRRKGISCALRHALCRAEVNGSRFAGAHHSAAEPLLGEAEKCGSQHPSFQGTLCSVADRMHLATPCYGSASSPPSQRLRPAVPDRLLRRHTGSRHGELSASSSCCLEGGRSPPGREGGRDLGPSFRLASVRSLEFSHHLQSAARARPRPGRPPACRSRADDQGPSSLERRRGAQWAAPEVVEDPRPDGWGCRHGSRLARLQAGMSSIGPEPGSDMSPEHRHPRPAFPRRCMPPAVAIWAQAYSSLALRAGGFGGLEFSRLCSAGALPSLSARACDGARPPGGWVERRAVALRALQVVHHILGAVEAGFLTAAQGRIGQSLRLLGQPGLGRAVPCGARHPHPCCFCMRCGLERADRADVRRLQASPCVAGAALDHGGQTPARCPGVWRCARCGRARVRPAA